MALRPELGGAFALCRPLRLIKEVVGKCRPAQCQQGDMFFVEPRSAVCAVEPAHRCSKSDETQGSLTVRRGLYRAHSLERQFGVTQAELQLMSRHEIRQLTVHFLFKMQLPLSTPKA